jgi:dihydrofolate reductase
MEDNLEFPENPRPKVALIVAMGANREIGSNNDLMWHLRTDMLFFRDTTMGHYVIMGRKNFDSIPAKYKPLNGRVNVIISRNQDFLYEECYTCSNLLEAIDIAQSNGEEKVFVIGGGQIYQLALDQDLVDEMYITHVAGNFPQADVFFPEVDLSLWNRTILNSVQADIQNEFGFEICHYTKR